MLFNRMDHGLTKFSRNMWNIEAYSKHYDSNCRIHLNCKVVKISWRTPSGMHLISFVRRRGTEWESSKVLLNWVRLVNWTDVHSLAPETLATKYPALCAGLHAIPSFPGVPGVEKMARLRQYITPQNTNHDHNCPKQAWILHTKP